MSKMKFYETEHEHGFPWNRVAAGYWWRYPNQHSSHVFSVDTLETKIVDGKLHCRRLIIKTNALPSWGKHFFSDQRVPVIEECIVDPVSKTLTWYVRNIGLSTFMATVEKAQLSASVEDPDKTVVKKQAWIDSSILGFRTAIKKFGIDRYKKNCVLATEGFETVLTKHYCLNTTNTPSTPGSSNTPSTPGSSNTPSTSGSSSSSSTLGSPNTTHCCQSSNATQSSNAPQSSKISSSRNPTLSKSFL